MEVGAGCAWFCQMKRSPAKNLLRLYVALTGSLSAYTIGLIDGYTPAHRRFLASGFICESCQEFLITRTLMADVVVYDGQGNVVPILQARSRGKQFGCPKCGHRWDFRRTKERT